VTGPSGFLEPDLETLLIFLCVRAADLGLVSAALRDVRRAELLQPDWHAVWRLANEPPLETVVRDVLVRTSEAAQDSHPNRAGSNSPPPSMAGLRGAVEWVSLLKEGFLPFRTAASEEFGDLMIVTPGGVFKPWALSNELAQASLEAIAGAAAPVVVDVGTGSGLIALSLARERSDATVFATDLSPLAVRAARKNARQAGVASIRVRQGDLLSALPPAAIGKLSMIVSNVPSDPPTVQRQGRVPRRTLVGPDADGLGLVRRLVNESTNYLMRGGRLVLMLRDWQRTSLAEDFKSQGFHQVAVTQSRVAPFSFYVLELVRIR